MLRDYLIIVGLFTMSTSLNIYAVVFAVFLQSPGTQICHFSHHLSNKAHKNNEYCLNKLIVVLLNKPIYNFKKTSKAHSSIKTHIQSISISLCLLACASRLYALTPAVMYISPKCVCVCVYAYSLFSNALIPQHTTTQMLQTKSSE